MYQTKIFKNLFVGVYNLYQLLSNILSKIKFKTHCNWENKIPDKYSVTA